MSMHIKFVEVLINLLIYQIELVPYINISAAIPHNSLILAYSLNTKNRMKRNTGTSV